MKIGEVAKRTGLTVRTLRHYEALGIMARPRRTEGGQRHYGTSELERLQHVVALRRLGLGLTEIAALLDRAESTPLDALEAHAAKVEAQITELDAPAQTTPGSHRPAACR